MVMIEVYIYPNYYFIYEDKQDIQMRLFIQDMLGI